jgi:hypothetical protein
MPLGIWLDLDLRLDLAAGFFLPLPNNLVIAGRILIRFFFRLFFDLAMVPFRCEGDGKN